MYGGAELVIVKLANYMTKRGIKNALLTTSILPEMLKDLDGTEVIVQRPALDIPEFNEMIALHRGIHYNLDDFDVINVHNYPAELSVFPYNKPVVWMCNEPILYLSQLKQSLLAKLKNKILLVFDKFVVKHYIKYAVVADEFNANRFEKLYGFKPEIIPYGIDYEFFSEGDRTKVLEELELFDKFIVLQAGMLTQFKNQMESIKTIESLKDKIPEIKLILAGSGDNKRYRIMLEKYVKEKNLEKYVIFTGHLTRERLRDLYHACNVLLHPIKPQGGWLSPFEALCAKRPIVVSTEMTVADIIKKEEIGIVTDDFSEAILDIYNNPNRFHEIAERGMVWVRENLRWEQFCERMVDLFYKAVEETK